MRLFVAVNFPAELRAAMWRAAAPLRGRGYPVKWVREDALHLTLKFLGEVDGEGEPAIVRAMDSAVTGTGQFVLPVGGFGAFPNARRARVVWVGCEAVPALELVQNRVEEQMSEIGYPVEGRPFRPHLTLGRVRRGVRPGELQGIEALLRELEFRGDADIVSVDLMESELSRAGARYSVRCSVPLEV
jgi:2'-5' RNA ligase